LEVNEKMPKYKITGLVCCILLMLMLVPAGCSKQSGNISIPVRLNNANNLGSLSFDLTYNPSSLTCTEVKLTKMAEGAMVESNSKEAGKVRIALISSKGITGSGDIVTLLFSPGSAEDSSSLELREVEAYGATTLIDIRTEVSPGSYSAKSKSSTPPEIRLVN
jgi:hypothetical protein